MPKPSLEPVVDEIYQARLYPWQSNLWQQLFVYNLQQEQFPQALLLAGVSGTGKKSLAFYLARSLLCQTPQNSENDAYQPCNHTVIKHRCRSCQLFGLGNHPDLYHISTPDDKKIIPVDNIRALIEWSVLSSQLNGRKVTIIEPAEALNINAANSLLKTLEEPTENSIIILVTHNKQMLLPTIRSRCQIIDITMPDQQQALSWLQHQGVAEAPLMLSLVSGAPLSAQAMAQNNELEVRRHIIEQLLSINNAGVDPVSVAEQLFKSTKVKADVSKSRAKKTLAIASYSIIYWFDSVIIDLIRLTYSVADSRINNIDYAEDLRQLSKRLYLRKLLKLSDSINKAYLELQGQTNLNLLFEQLLIDWHNCRQ